MAHKGPQRGQRLAKNKLAKDKRKKTAKRKKK